MSLSAAYPHRIRLRGPWDCEALDGPPPQRVAMPCRWLEAGLGDFHGTARFTRKFGYPGRVDDTEHVWLTCDGCTGVVEVRLNDQDLSGALADNFAFDVTPILAARNRLEVLIDGVSEQAGLWGEVALEIRKDAFLSAVTARWTGSKLCVTGLAVGVSPQSLELYTLVDQRHADYRTIAPTPAGAPFRIELTDVPPTSQSVRVELINVSSIWYVVELPIMHWQSE